ncbi:MAG: Lrp/AsnC family transcriptional regulator, partial [Pseudomonadota bacterium]
MDKTDNALISALRHDARASISDLAVRLGLARGTVRARLARLQSSGEIVGFSVVLKGDLQRDPVRALMMIAIEGRGTDRIIRQLNAMIEVRQLYSTNGRWDVIVEIGTETLDALDAVLFLI